MHKKSRRIIVAKNVGFCSGVRRAVSIAEELSKKHSNVFTVDEILHNEEELKRLEKAGVKLAENKGGEVILLPAHGALKSEISNAKLKFNIVVDATCPLVLRTLRIINTLKEDKYKIAVVGDLNHRETKVLSGECGDNLLGIFDNASSVNVDKVYPKIAVVSQSTATEELLFVVASELMKHSIEFRMFNTICEETIKRQKEALKIAERVECMIVVGGKKSANSFRLYEKVRLKNKNTIFINSQKDLLKNDFSKYKSIGITSGTSTPNWLIEQIVDFLKKDFQ